MSQAFIKAVDDSYKAQLSNFLFRLFDKRSGIKTSLLNKYINNDTIYKFALALTHPSFDNENNYEYLETLGDATLNKCVVWYIHRRFPQLKTLPDANYRMSLLKSSNISRVMFAKLSNKLGIDKLIRYNPTYIKKGKVQHVIINDKLRTDTFESIMGCIEDVIDYVENIAGIGVSIVYNILASLMDEVPISIELEDIEDSKSVFLELVSQKKIFENKAIDTQSKHIVNTEVGDRTEYTFVVSLTFKIKHPQTDRTLELSFVSEPAKTKLQAEKQVYKTALSQLRKDYGF